MALHLNGYERVIFAMILLALMAGCQRLTAASALAPIHYVAIDDGVSDDDVQAQVGEEVRWVNVRPTPVSVVFNGLQHEEVSCEYGFFNSTDSHIAAVILPDHNASLCFTAVGRRTYRVLDARRPGVELNHEAAVEVIEAR
jgi:hypothetical protein